MNQNIFVETGNIYRQSESNFSVFPQLPKGIYNLCVSPKGELFLEKTGEEFFFGFKLYGVDDTLVNHVINTYAKSEVKHNIGVLLNGAKGTGKTVTAKLLCNKLNLPVIVISSEVAGLEDFVAKLNQDVIFFMDEFEKNFRRRGDSGEYEAGQSLLSIMDGVYNNGNHSHIFILTTNELKVNDNLISRPSRIRYIKSYGSVIDRRILELYIDDNLKYPERKEEILEFVDSLEIATIDIIKSIVEEVNIHNCSIADFKAIFNVRQASYSYYVRGWYLESEDLKGFDFENDGYTDEYIKKFGHPYTEKEFINDCNEFERSKQRHRPWYETYCITQPIYKLKAGDIIDGKTIIEPMNSHGFMVLSCGGRKGKEIAYVYVENPNAKPSIYNETGRSYDVSYDGLGFCCEDSGCVSSI